ncbi:MAG: coiled-coil protein [Candidatus Methanoplasma sp.]|jgi:uncharacterized coiled-coil DUF342 family protein|nr:coiled-coil protein [Candidatus Methanoplasma sp.]
MEEFVEEKQADSQEEQLQAAEAVDATVEQGAQVEETPVQDAEPEAAAPVEGDEAVSSENLENLEQKRSIVNNDAERHRRLRDDLNRQTKEWKAKRDGLNSQVRALVDEAGRCREERDSFNQKVRDTKVVRDEWNQKVSALKDQISALRPERSADEKNEVPVKALKKQLQDLELTQQTRTLGKDKENEIVKQISQLARQIESREKSLEQNGEVREVILQLREAKTQAEECHRQVSEHAEAAQTAHDKMLKLYGEADALRKEADGAQAKFVECKQAADEEHKKHIEQIRSVHEIDKDVAGIRTKKSASRKKSFDDGAKKEAKELFERFKAGEKLSTDGLMTLQKSGYL